MSDDPFDKFDDDGPRKDSNITDEQLEFLKMERSVRPDLTNEQLTRQILEEAGPQAAMAIVNLAIHGANENTRLNAAKYVTDNLINEGASTTKQKWEDLVGEVVSDAELHANAGTESE